MASKCALVGRECPKTNDSSAKVYCPAWVVGVPENEKDGSGRLIATYTYTGCLLPKLLPYMVGMTAEADHAHAAANQARDAAQSTAQQFEFTEQSLRGALLAPLLSSLKVSSRLEEPKDCLLLEGD